MHQELLMHVAAAHIQDRQQYAANQRLARSARREAKAAVLRPRRRLSWAFSRPRAQSLTPSH